MHSMDDGFHLPARSISDNMVHRASQSPVVLVVAAAAAVVVVRIVRVGFVVCYSDL